MAVGSILEARGRRQPLAAAFHPLQTLCHAVMLLHMNRQLVLALTSVALIAAPAAAQVADKASEVARIESECGLKKGTLTVTGDHIQLLPSPDEAYERVDCAIDRLNKAQVGKLGFVGNEADPHTILRPPLRYIAEGSSAQMAALMKAAQADNWVIDKTGTASDGSMFVQLESGATMTFGQSEHLLNRIWRREFGDIFFGMSPRKLSDPNQLDD